jgi:outer membrane lipoprotein-sorting protein
LLVLAAGTATQAGTTPGPTASPNLQEIMDKYAAAMGGRTLLAKIMTQRVVSSFTLLDRTMVVTTTIKAPDYYLQVVQPEGGGGELKAGFDGKFAWLQDAGGVVQLLSGQRRAEVVSDAVGANNSELFPDRWPTSVSLRPTERINSKEYYVVTIMPRGGVAHDVILDMQTFQPDMDRRTEPDATTISTVDSFGAGPMGELFPLTVTTTRSDGFPTVTSILRNVHDNVPVSKSLFSPPVSQGTETI